MDAVVTSHLSFTYPDGECVGEHRSQTLKNVSWTVRSGEFCLLEGVTGSGKTTLIRLLHPTLAPYGRRSGSVRVFGHDVEDARDSASSDIGYVAQNPASQIVCDTVWHELAFGLENRNVSQDQMRRRVAEVAHYFGIESWFDDSTAQLSGGQMQILNLASTLCTHPRLLLLDEPTAQLDPVSAANFVHAVFRVNRDMGTTVIVATHAPEIFRDYATCEVHLDRGRVCKGPLETIDVVMCAEGALHDSDAADRGVDRQRANGASDGGSSPIVRLHDVWFRYKTPDGGMSGASGRPFGCVIYECDWTCERGCVHALVGGNGCGKTTMLLLASCALAPNRGRVENESRAQAYLPQDPAALFGCETVYDELHEWQNGCAYTEHDIRRICDMLAIPYGDEHGAHRLGTQNPHDLSGGQQQLLALAKVTLTSPDLLLLDEPTKGLDGIACMRVIDVLRRMSRDGTTIVLATHDMAVVAALADTVSTIFDGQIASTEPTRSFFCENLFFRPNARTCKRIGMSDAQMSKVGLIDKEASGDGPSDEQGECR